MNLRPLRHLGFALVLALTFTEMAWSRQGPRSDGGGTYLGQLTLDQVEAQAEQIDPTQLEAYQKIVGPNLERLRLRFPDFVSYLEPVLNKSNHLNFKPWLMDSNPLKAGPGSDCLTDTIIDGQTELAACQSPFEIRIDKNKFYARPLETQAWLIQHELLVSLMLDEGYNNIARHHTGSFRPAHLLRITDEDVRAVNAAIFNLEKYTDDEFRVLLIKRGFDRYYSQKEIAFVLQVREWVFKSICQSNVPSTHKLLQETLLGYARRFELPPGPGAEFFGLMEAAKIFEGFPARDVVACRIGMSDYTKGVLIGKLWKERKESEALVYGFLCDQYRRNSKEQNKKMGLKEGICDPQLQRNPFL